VDHDDENDWSHLEGMLAPINNACPRCQWFSPSAGDWPAWDGEVPTVRAPTFNFGTGDAATVMENAREAAVAARVAAAATSNSDSCIERIYAIFNGEEEIPELAPTPELARGTRGLSRSDMERRLLEFGFDLEEVDEAIYYLTDEQGRLEEGKTILAKAVRTGGKRASTKVLTEV
jgi:hypothetical protein